MNGHRSTKLMVAALEHVCAKNRGCFYRLPSLQQRPRHFSSKPNPTMKSSNNASLLQSITQERNAKIWIGVLPTLFLVVGYLMEPEWSVPLASILTGFGVLGRENYRLEDKQDDEPPLLIRTNSSSLSSTTSTTTSESSLQYTDETTTIEGIKVPSGCQVNGNFLERQGSGLRCFAFFRGISVRVYVATLYSSQPIQHADDWPDELQMDFTFLRGFTVGQCRLAWEKQFDESVSYRYDGLEQDKQDFLNKIATESMKANGTVTVQFQGDSTFIFDQGTCTGEIIGKDFQRAFLSMWFGEKPVTNELKAKLLGQE